MQSSSNQPGNTVASARAVMDVAAPSRSQRAQISQAAPARTPAARTEVIAHSRPEIPELPTPPKVARRSQAAAIADKPHFPVALITVTVFMMLVLSVLAVTVYITSQTA